jgi:hypothetical protein
MLRRIAFSVAISLFSFLMLAQSAPQAVSTDTSPTDHARVFITDSQSWEMSGGAGGSSSGFGGATQGGARPQTAEIIKTFGERCPDVVTNNIQARANYVVVLDHEGGKGLLRHRNKVAVFARASGDSIVSKSTMSLGGSVQEACEAIQKDWAKNSASIRAAENAEAAAKDKPAGAAPPQVLQVAQSNVTKISVASAPAGADIEVDGGFVGNTPSTIEVASGEHTVKVTKSGYKDWERKLKAGGGNVNLNVELEAQTK